MMVVAFALRIVALLVVIVMVVMMVMVLVLLVLIIIVVMVMVMVMVFVLVLVVVIVMMVVAFALRIVALLIVVMVMVMMVLVFLLFLLLAGHLGELLQGRLQGVLPLHGGKDHLAGELAPGGGDDDGVGVVLPEKGQHFRQLRLRHVLGPAQDDGAGALHLVVEELAEVLHVDLGLLGVHHGGEGIELYIVGVDALHGADHVGELAHARGLDQDPVRGVLRQNLLQGPAEVAHQRAADAAGVHLVHLDARVLHERAVDADLAELVLDQHQLFALVRFLDQLLDEGGFPRAQKPGEDVYLSHFFLASILNQLIIARNIRYFKGKGPDLHRFVEIGGATSFL